MFKRMTLLRRRPGDPPEVFRAHWSTVHSRLVLALPGIRRYVQNDIVDASPAVDYSGIVELWFDDESALRAAFASEAGRALPPDEANFLGGKIVSDVEEHVVVAGDRGPATAKLVSLVRSRSMAQPHEWNRWHARLCASHRGVEGLSRMAHHRVAMQQNVGCEAAQPRDIADFIVYHFTDRSARTAFVRGAADRVELRTADPAALHIRIDVAERVLRDTAIVP